MTLELDDIRLRQGDFVLTADWRIAASTRVAIVGPSGAGKSTLLALIGGFLQPEAGRVLWDAADITKTSPSERPVANLFQDGNLFPHLSVLDNVGLGISPRLKLDPEARARVGEALERVGLGGLGERKPAQLSGGQQSRAALARILVQGRPIMLLDEPFAALGPALRVEMLSLVQEIARDQGATVLMVSHEPRDALSFADATVLVAGGVAHPPVATQALFDDPPEALADYLG